MLLALARSARQAYEDALVSDGVTATVWSGIAADMFAAADALEQAGALRGIVQCQRDRAVDAAQRAQFALRMVEVARRTKVIDMATIGAAS